MRLLIFASKSDLITISNIIDKLDVVLQQVLIEAIVMEVSLGNDLSYGVSYLQTKPTTFGDVASGIGAIRNVPFLSAANFGSLATNAAGSLPSGFSYYASFMNFDATATAVANDSRVNVISPPTHPNLACGRSRTVCRANPPLRHRGVIPTSAAGRRRSSNSNRLV
jgi:general secretion pathway protein D